MKHPIFNQFFNLTVHKINPNISLNTKYSILVFTYLPYIYKTNDGILKKIEEEEEEKFQKIIWDFYNILLLSSIIIIIHQKKKKKRGGGAQSKKKRM